MLEEQDDPDRNVRPVPDDRNDFDARQDNYPDPSGFVFEEWSTCPEQD